MRTAKVIASVLTHGLAVAAAGAINRGIEAFGLMDYLGLM
jgi:hypothetical protein